MMVNRHRGEVEIEVNGQSRVMRLTLGALAALEDGLGSKTLVELVESFETGQFKARDLLLLLWAGLNGGGWDVSFEEVGDARIGGGPLYAAKLSAQLLALTFGSDER